MEELKILELFSGIGGMHYALQASSMPGQIIAAIDINENANATYKHNFPDSKCMNNNIQKIKCKDFQAVNCILMSPPCQPFTRNGNFKDVDDRRSDAFLSVCEIIKSSKLPELKFILMENVMGFEKSQMRNIFVDALQASGFHFQEFIITPTHVGVTNTRHRYYCIGRKDSPFSFAASDILKSLPSFPIQPEVPLVSSYVIENVDHNRHLLPDDILLKRFQVLDICTTDSTNSMCFTKSYTRFVEGTGSVFCSMSREELNKEVAAIEQLEDNLELKKKLRLRFFAPDEVSRLMSFPPTFNFPDSISEKQRYKLLGNSINVSVVSELIKLMVQR